MMRLPAQKRYPLLAGACLLLALTVLFLPWSTITVQTAVAGEMSETEVFAWYDSDRPAFANARNYNGLWPNISFANEGLASTYETETSWSILRKGKLKNILPFLLLGAFFAVGAERWMDKKGFWSHLVFAIPFAVVLTLADDIRKLVQTDALLANPNLENQITAITLFWPTWIILAISLPVGLAACWMWRRALRHQLNQGESEA